MSILYSTAAKFAYLTKLNQQHQQTEATFTSSATMVKRCIRLALQTNNAKQRNIVNGRNRKNTYSRIQKKLEKEREGDSAQLI